MMQETSEEYAKHMKNLANDKCKEVYRRICELVGHGEIKPMLDYAISVETRSDWTLMTDVYETKEFRILLDIKDPQVLLAGWIENGQVHANLHCRPPLMRDITYQDANKDTLVRFSEAFDFF